jgi:hypothetical protein
MAEVEVRGLKHIGPLKQKSAVSNIAILLGIRRRSRVGRFTHHIVDESAVLG